MSEEINTKPEPAPAVNGAGVNAAADRMKRGRGRPPGSTNKPKPGAGAPQDPPPAKEHGEQRAEAAAELMPWDEPRVIKALEQIARLGTKLGVPEWDIGDEDRKFIAPFLVPYASRWMPSPIGASWLLTLVLVAAIFGNAIMATIERIQTVYAKLAEIAAKIRARFDRYFRGAPAAPEQPAADPAAQPRRAEPDEPAFVLKPIPR